MVGKETFGNRKRRESREHWRGRSFGKMSVRKVEEILAKLSRQKEKEETEQHLFGFERESDENVGRK